MANHHKFMFRNCMLAGCCFLLRRPLARSNASIARTSASRNKCFDNISSHVDWIQIDQKIKMPIRECVCAYYGHCPQSTKLYTYFNSILSIIACFCRLPLFDKTSCKWFWLRRLAKYIAISTSISDFITFTSTPRCAALLYISQLFIAKRN